MSLISIDPKDSDRRNMEMPGFLNRERASAYMADIGVDAMILTQPESITYATGCHPGVASTSRRATAGILLVPADPASPLAAVVGDGQTAEFSRRSGIADVRGHPIWFDCAVLPPEVSRDKSPAGHLLGIGPGGSGLSERPAQFNPEKALAALADIMRERGYANARIGLELTFVPAIDMPLFEAALSGVTWADASHVMCRLRAIKTPEEVDILRRTAFLSDTGLYHLRDKISPGHTAADLRRIWRAGVDAQAAKDGKAGADSSWGHVSVGPRAFAEGGPMSEGDIVRLDFGVVIQGYSSDVARTWVHGQPSVAQRAVYDALRDTYEACLPMLRPGTAIRDLHAKATGLMRDKGFTNYVRGHFGHGLGASVFSEEWPFLSPDEDLALDENMVIAFELPYYIDGLGNFNVEDQMIITSNSYETMYTYDMSFQSV